MSEIRCQNLDIGQIRSMKYNQLRAIAKEMGIKCNMKASKLIDAIFEKSNIAEDENVNSKQPSKVNIINDKKSQESAPIIEKSNLDKNEVSCSSSRRLIRQNTFSLSPSTPICKTSNDINKSLSNRRLPCPISADEDDCKKFHRNEGVKFSEQTTSTTRSKLPRLKRLNGHATPNFKLIHQRQFDKMESIDAYVVKKEAKRAAHKAVHEQLSKSLRENKIRLKQNSKTPTCKQSLFQPTVLETKGINFNFGKAKGLSTSGKKNELNGKETFKFIGSPLKENVNDSTKTKLARCKDLLKTRLRYKLPGNSQSSQKSSFGSMSRLSNKTNTSSSSNLSKREIERKDQREMLRGVRLNRRFQLQLECRGITPKKY